MEAGKVATWQARPVRDEDLERLIKLAQASFPDDRETSDAAFLRWQYFENPAGRVVGWVAESTSRDELAGSYCVIPTRLVLGGRDTRASLSLNTMTHPDYRRQGIFTRLAELTYKDCAEAGLVLTTGIPNDQSYHGLAGPLRFKTVGRRTLIVKILRSGGVMRSMFGSSVVASAATLLAAVPQTLLFRRARPAHGYSTDRVHGIDARFDELWTRARDIAPNIMVRDSAFLRWRFASCPSRPYAIFGCTRSGRLVGYIVVRISLQRGMRVAFITDLLVDPAIDADAVVRSLLSEAESWSASEAADLIAFHTPRRQRYAAILLATGYWRVPDKVLPGPHTFMFRWHRADLAEPSSATAVESWYVTDADNDRP